MTAINFPVRIRIGEGDNHRLILNASRPLYGPDFDCGLRGFTVDATELNEASLQMNLDLDAHRQLFLTEAEAIQYARDYVLAEYGECDHPDDILLDLFLASPTVQARFSAAPDHWFVS